MSRRGRIHGLILFGCPSMQKFGLILKLLEASFQRIFAKRMGRRAVRPATARLMRWMTKCAARKGTGGAGKATLKFPPFSGRNYFLGVEFEPLTYPALRALKNISPNLSLLSFLKTSSVVPPFDVISSLSV